MTSTPKGQIDRSVSQLIASAERAKKAGDDTEQSRLLAEASDLLVKDRRPLEAINIHLANRDYAAAATVAEKIDDWARAAQLWFRAGDFERMAGARLKNGEYTAAAEVYERMKDYQRAAELYESHGDLERGAVLYEKLGEYIKAANLLVRMLKEQGGHHLMGPALHEAYRRAAKMYANAGETDRAVAVLRLGGQQVFAGQLLARAGRHQEAINVLAEGGDLLGAAEVARSMGDEKQALRILAQRALKEGRVHDAALQYDQAGDFAQAAKLYEYANEPAHAADAYERAGQHRLAAALYEKVGSFEDAIRCLRVAGGSGAAEAALKNVVPREGVAHQRPRGASNIYDMAQSLIARARAGDPARYADAIQALHRVEEKHPHYVRARTMLAVALSEQGNRARALEVLQHLLANARYTEEHLAALYEYGKLLEVEGHLAEARSTYRMIVDMHPTFMDVSTRLMDLGDTGSFEFKKAADIAAPLSHKPVVDTVEIEPPAPSPRPPSSEPAPATAPEDVWAAVSGEYGDLESLIGLIIRGRFRIEQLLGVDTQSRVYLARDVVLDRVVAIKVLNADAATDQASLRRFFSEARYGAKVHHPGCLGVYDFGQENGVLFIAMEHFEGRPLRDLLLDQGSFLPFSALQIVCSLADALDAVHKAGLVHRDVKPSNVLVAADGSVRLAEFGLAMALDAPPKRLPALSGSIRYMAPEQVYGTPSPKSDVYSLGVVFYELLSGRPPFETTPESVAARRTAPPPELPWDVPVTDAVRKMLAVALHPEPDARCSALQLKEAIERELYAYEGPRVA